MVGVTGAIGFPFGKRQHNLERTGDPEPQVLCQGLGEDDSSLLLASTQAFEDGCMGEGRQRGVANTWPWVDKCCLRYEKDRCVEA